MPNTRRACALLLGSGTVRCLDWAGLNRTTVGRDTSATLIDSHGDSHLAHPGLLLRWKSRWQLFPKGRIEKIIIRQESQTDVKLLKKEQIRKQECASRPVCKTGRCLGRWRSMPSMAIGPHRRSNSDRSALFVTYESHADRSEELVNNSCSNVHKQTTQH